jgi:hypothetical protein
VLQGILGWDEIIVQASNKVAGNVDEPIVLKVLYGVIRAIGAAVSDQAIVVR